MKYDDETRMALVRIIQRAARRGRAIREAQAEADDQTPTTEQPHDKNLPLVVRH